MNVSFKAIEFGQSYERPFLAKLWGYQNYHAISKGVVTPIKSKYIILFVTKDKQDALPQYNDYIDGNLLFWEGEEQHSSDNRIIEAKNNRDEVHLFYRDTHHSPFVYFGIITLLDYQLRDISPSEFIFQVEALSSTIDAFSEVREHASEYKTLAKTEQDAIVKSRLGQGAFRYNLIRLWGSCSITGLHNITLLRASHIKPWKASTNPERLDKYNGLLLIPNYDLLFDKGLITFNTSGHVIISERLDLFGRRVFHIDESLKLRRVFNENKRFLDYHRSEVFR
ncbi:MAG: HNH endonuclease [Chloroflexi bacterium]|nr:HNH endonuclease [Chloroflexota bacterium]